MPCTSSELPVGESVDDDSAVWATKSEEADRDGDDETLWLSRCEATTLWERDGEKQWMLSGIDTSHSIMVEAAATA